MINPDLLAHDARIASLEAKLAKMQATIDALLAAKKPKRRPVTRPAQDAADREAHAHMRAIAEPIAAQWSITLERMRAHDTRRVFRKPRYLAWKACQDAGYSSVQIGRYFGDRDHSTILSGIKKLESETPTV